MRLLRTGLGLTPLTGAPYGRCRPPFRVARVGHSGRGHAGMMRRANSAVVAAAALLAAVAMLGAAARGEQRLAQAQQQADPNARSNAEMVLTLLRTTIIAVHQANQTGNYTVLRDLSAPGFRDKNTAADLARIFQPIREANIDLGAVVLLDPNLSQVELGEQNMLHIAGALATRPVAVSFELLFQPVAGVWRLNGLAITPTGAAGAPPLAPAAKKGPAPTVPKGTTKK